jgi:histidinol-phosphatase (PHP family)
MTRVRRIRLGSRVFAPKVESMKADDNEACDDERLYFDSHMHTPLCKHADGHPREYVAQGVEAGLKGVIFTCHSPMPNRFSHAVRMTPEQFDEYVDLIAEGADSAPDGFEVRLGMESDFFPGMESWLEELHQRADFDYVLGSVHWHIPEYRAAFFTGDLDALEVQYFDHLAESAETGLFDSLAHPDLVKNAGPDSWDFAARRDDIARALDRIAATGVAMELNTSGFHKPVPEMNPGPEMLAMMAERGIRVVIGSDSHVPWRVAADFDLALSMLEEAGFNSVSVFEKRSPAEIKIVDARRSLAMDRGGVVASTAETF